MVYCFPTLSSRHCVLCGANNSTDLCAPCDAGLPRITNSCRQCGIPLTHDDLCGDCLIAPPLFTRCIAPLRYEPPISHLVGAFKYQSNFNHGRILSQLLLGRLQDEARIRNEDMPSIAALLPVPLHWRRRWLRGFNQTEIIADELSLALRIPLQTRWLRKIRGGSAQQQLDADARRHNLRDAFACTQDVAGLRLAVIDDVVTTGATANAIAGTLLEHGAASVQIWALARTP